MADRRFTAVSDGVLLAEHRSLRREILRLDRDISRHRRNPSGDGVVTQMNELRQRDLLRHKLARIEIEIRSRKQAGTWQQAPVKRTMVKKENTPRKQGSPTPPNSGQDSDYWGGDQEQLPIIVFDADGPRAWRESDGPIHGNVPSETKLSPNQKKADT